MVFLKNGSEFVNVLIQALNPDPVTVTKAVSFFQFMASKHIIVPFQALVILTKSTVILHHGSAPSGSPCRLRMETSPSIMTGYAVLTILSMIASEIGLSLFGSELIRSYQPSVWYCVQKIIDRSHNINLQSSLSFIIHYFRGLHKF